MAVTRSNSVTIAALFLLLTLVSAACEPPSGGTTPQPTRDDATEEPGTPTNAPATVTPSPAPIVDTPTVDVFPTITPTPEFCEAVTIEYRVLVPTLYVRAGKGTTFARVGELSAGDTFIGSQCVDPDASNTYYWTRILEEGHQYQGQWVAYLSVDYSARFLE